MAVTGILHDGSKTVAAAGTPVQLSTTSTRVNWLLIQPLAANVGAVYLGGSTVTATRGFVFNVGDSAVAWPIMAGAEYNLNAIYIDAANNGDGVQFIYVVL